MYTCGMYGFAGQGSLALFPIVVRHTRLDSRQAENALLSTVAYTSNDYYYEGWRTATPDNLPLASVGGQA